MPNWTLEVPELHQRLNDRGYICSEEFAAKVLTSINSKPMGGAFLYGMAGTGKSYLPQILAQVLNRPLYVHQCTQGTREEDLLVKLMPSENTTSGVKVSKGKLFRAACESRKKPVILMLDEWDKTRPSVDGFFLDFLQYGRLSIPGVEGGEVYAEMDNLTIFITANDEREFHEALLRRFPMIHVDPMSASDVVKALNITHSNHSYLPQMLDLYLRSVAAAMPKPATIQELRQLMDAITTLGSNADWNDLVYQYVTKTPENHEMLSNQRQVEGVDVRRAAKIDAEGYGVDEVIKKRNSKNPEMPRLTELLQFNESFKKSVEVPENASAVIKRSSQADSIVMRSHLDSEDPETPAFSEWGVITEHYNFLLEDFASTDIAVLLKSGEFEGCDGEIKISDKYVTRKEINRMIAGKWYVHKRDKHELIARRHVGRNGNYADLRYREESGLEIVAPIGLTPQQMASLFKMNKNENLVYSYTLDDASGDFLLNIGSDKSSNVAVCDIFSNVASGTYSLGNSLLKSMENHEGFCRMMKPLEHCNYVDFEGMESLLNGHTVAKSKSVEDGLLITATNMRLRFYDYNGTSPYAAFLKIDGAVNGLVMKTIVGWFRNPIPVYRCFKHCGDISDKLQKCGWKVNSKNSKVFVRNGIYARISYDHVMFAAFLRSDEQLSSSSLSLSMKSKIKRIESLEKAFKSQDS